MAWVDKSEDELTEAIEAAEGTKDLNAIVGILVHATAGDLDEMGPVIEAACDALLRYSAPTGGDGLSAGEAGACEATLGAMVKCMDEASVIEVCLGCLRNLALAGSPNLEKLAESAVGGGCAALVVRAMEQHGADANEPTLQEQACLAVEALASGSAAHKEAFNRAGAATAVEASKALITNERNKSYPDRALAALA